MPPTDHPSVDNPVPGEIVCSRFFARPRDEVFAAFSDPAELARWWGPAGFTNRFHQFDFRPNGAWRFTMRGADGTTYEMNQQFTEIVRPERIILRHFQQTHDFVLAIAFAARDGGTAVTWAMRFDDPAEGERLRGFLARANAENLDRLAAHLALTTQKP